MQNRKNQTLQQLDNNANPDLIDLYVNLYLKENTQEGVSYDMGYSQTYIYKLNRKFLEFLYEKQKEIEK